MKVKVFMAVNELALEDKMNKWLEENTNAMIKTAHMSSHFDDRFDKLYVVVFYEEYKEKEEA